MTHTTSAPPVFDPQRIRPLTEAQLWQLMQFLSDDRVKQLKGMSYVEAWDVKATLTRVFGFGGFSTQILSEELIHREQVPQRNDNTKMNFRVAYRITMRLIIPQLGAFWDEAAVGTSSQPDPGEALDMAVKSAASDALKRCATLLGTQFGLSLYNDGATQDVVRNIVAPGQEWRNGSRVDPLTGRPLQRQATDQVVQTEVRQLAAGESVAHLRGEGVTEEQHAANVDLLNQALSAKKKQQEHRAGYDVPVVLDPSIDTAPDKRGLIDGGPEPTDPEYGGSYGKSEGMAYDNA